MESMNTKFPQPDRIAKTLPAMLSVLLFTFGLACNGGGAPVGGGNGNNGGMNGGGGGGGDGTDGGANGGGSNGSGNNGGGGVSDVQSLRVVLTNVVAGSGGEIKAGKDIIAVGTGNESGVQYIIPSRGDVDPRSLSNFDFFVTAGFAVTGSWIIARTFDGIVGLFNGETEQLTMIPESDLAVSSGAGVPGSPEFWTDGDFAVTVVNPTRVADGMTVKLINFSTTPVTITSFPDPPVTPTQFRENETWQAAVDADAQVFVVQLTNFFVVYDMKDPSAQPQVWDLSNLGGITNVQLIHLDAGHVIYQTFEKSGNNRDLTRIIDLSDGTSFLVSENPSRGRPLALENNVFGYFTHVSDADVSTNDTARVVLGTLNGAMGPEVNLLNDARTPIGSDPGNGIVGYGCSLAVTPDARYRFIAGCGTVGTAEYLQVSTGGGFEVLADQIDSDPLDMGLAASEVHASNTIAAFQTNAGMAYIILP